MAHLVHHLLTALPAPLLPFIRDDFNLDYTQSGLVASAFSLAYGVGQLPAGWLADRFGPRIVITIGICGVALAGLLVGLSQTYVVMLVFLVLMGLVGGGYHPSAVPLISASVEPSNRGRALGFHLIGGGGSFFLAPLVAAAMATAWGWRASFIGLAIPTMVFGIIFYRRLSQQAGRRKTQPVADHYDGTTPGRWRRLVAFIILNTFTQAVLFSVTAFIPLFMVDHFGVGKEMAAIFLAITYSAGLWASPLGGYLSDRLGRMRVILALCFLTGPVIYLLTLVSYGPGIGALLLGLGMVMYLRMPASEAYIIGQTPERHRSTIFGVFYFSGMEAGGLLTPVMGSLVDQFGFQTSFTLAGVALVVVTLVCSLFLWGSRD